MIYDFKKEIFVFLRELRGVDFGLGFQISDRFRDLRIGSAICGFNFPIGILIFLFADLCRILRCVGTICGIVPRFSEWFCNLLIVPAICGMSFPI
jgi:hypothetical protein